MLRKLLQSTFLLFLILFLVNIAGSILPIGVGAVGNLRLDNHQMDELDFEESSMQLLLTNERMSFISSRPSSYYSLDKFYGRNTLFSLLSAFLLSLILYLIKDLSARRRVLIVNVFALLIITSVHLSYWNWWGFSNLYSFGVSLTTFVSLVLSAVLANFLIFKNINSIKPSI